MAAKKSGSKESATINSPKKAADAKSSASDKLLGNEVEPASTGTTAPVKKAVVEESNVRFIILNLLVTVAAFALRFFRISKPSEVVFDEVHFGKFASHYLQREYYFDLHPPLAKLMFAAVGWLVGYDGRFKFDNIGDDYITHNVPYIAYRSLAASLGSLSVTAVFLILQSCGFTALACTLGACLVAFDCAQITENRLILLDAALMFFMVGALLSYVRFRLARHHAFGIRWWFWLSSTGFFLSCVMSVKYVGLFTYLTVGVAVLADLYNLLDIRGKKAKDVLSVKLVVKHFAARFYALAVGPFLLYLFWFYVHFSILTNSGPGNNHMSPDFQATLNKNPMVEQAIDVHFFDTVSIKLENADIFLHSHPHNYPLQYPDGRISSQGQQVTGYSFQDDANSLWQILPPVPFNPEDEHMGAAIAGPQEVMLRHVGTDSYLLTHDVASPGYPTNEEFTTVSKDLAYGDRHKDTIFQLDLLTSPNDIVRTKMTHFRLKHVATGVAMWKADKMLPDWGYNQVEINGNKKIDGSGTTWIIDSVHNVPAGSELESKRRTIPQGEPLPKRPFLTDYLELQGRMFKSNNQLTATHPYMSSPHTWPLLTRGISFWSSKKEGDQSQIYLVGNYVGWYLIDIAVLVFLGLFVFDHLAILRQFEWITPYARQKLHGTLFWLFLGWAFHYLPFYLMGRQLFLHHYLPAQISGSLLVGGLVDLITGQCDEPRGRYTENQAIKIVVYTAIAAEVLMFVYWSPFVYGLHLSAAAVRAHEWFDIQLQFSKGV